jgi:hypothetical protein
MTSPEDTGTLLESNSKREIGWARQDIHVSPRQSHIGAKGRSGRTSYKRMASFGCERQVILHLNSAKRLGGDGHGSISAS